jgi:hypothetical protein
LTENNEKVIFEPFVQFFFAKQSCEVFRIAGIGFAVAFGATFFVADDEVGFVKW